MTEELKLTVLFHGEQHDLLIDAHGNLLDALQHTQALRLAAVCGGAGVCGKCKIQVVRGELAPSPSDLAFFAAEELRAGYRLACTAYPDKPLTIRLLSPPDGDIAVTPLLESNGGRARSLRIETRALGHSDSSLVAQLLKPTQTPTAKLLADCSALAGSGGDEASVVTYLGQAVYIGSSVPELYAVGVDIGTTTVTFALVSLQTGRVLSHLSETNRQRQYGADIVTRIMKAGNDGHSSLHRIVCEQISGGIVRLLQSAAVEPQQVIKIAVAGNTTMLHLFLGLRCDTLGKYPYTPVTLEFLELPYRDVLEGALSHCTVDVLPGLSTYVGADITAGILMTGLHSERSPSLLVDIGTNGEMVLAAKNGLLCTSTSAGPAFEGGNIRWGTSSVPGAICSVRPQKDGFLIRTIEDRPPVGICGSGVVDAVYAFQQQGLLDSSGRFAKTVDKRGVFLANTPDGEEIRFTQKDVRELQLSKSAIRTGIDELLSHSGCRLEEIQKLYVSGGFGSKIAPESGVGIGLLPATLLDRIIPVGNSALGGVVRYLLGARGRQELEEIVRSCRELRLPKEQTFQQIFIDNLSLKKY